VASAALTILDSTRVALRYFTAEEANDALADVRPLAETMVARRRAFLEAQARREQLLGDIAGNGGGIPPSELAAVAEDEERLATRLAATLERIQALGVLVKDLDTGLVDFPSVRDGEEVLLCWRVGEDAVRYWHGVDEGFAGRKPL
jgi:hypothetical protein